MLVSVRIHAYLSPLYSVDPNAVITTPAAGTQDCFPKWQANGSYVLVTSAACLDGAGELTGLNAIRGLSTLEVGNFTIDNNTIQNPNTINVDTNNDVNINSTAAGKVKITNTNGSIELGSTDPSSRRQIWNYMTDASMRLGSLQQDGDPTDVKAEGIVVYGPNSQGTAINSGTGNFGYARVKADRIGLLTSINNVQDYYFRADPTSLYLKNDSSTKTFEVDRLTGQIDTSLGAGVVHADAFGILSSSLVSTPELSGIVSEVQGGTGADLSGVAENSLFYQGPSDDFKQWTGWSRDSLTGGLTAYTTVVPDDTGGPYNPSILKTEAELDMQNNANQYNFTNLVVDTHVDRTGSGGNLTGGLLGASIALSHEGNGLINNPTALQINANMGTGTSTGSAASVSALSVGTNVANGFGVPYVYGINSNVVIGATASVETASVFSGSINGDTNNSMNATGISYVGNVGAAATMATYNFQGTADSYNGVSTNFNGSSNTYVNLLGASDTNTSTGTNITGFNTTIAGTYSSGATGINSDVSAATVTGGDPVSYQSSGGYLNFNSTKQIGTGAAFVQGNVFAVNGAFPAGAARNSDYIGTNMPLLLVADDDHTPGGFGLGLASVGYVSTTDIAPGKTVAKLTNAVSAINDTASGAGSTVTDTASFRSLGVLTTGGTAAFTNVSHFKAETNPIPVGTNIFGINIEDPAAENYISKSLVIGGAAFNKVTNSDVALEIASKKQIKLGVMTSAEMTGLNPVKGSIVYNDDSDFPNFYNGTNWLQFGSGGGNVSPLTTKGDIYTFNTDNARLAVGTNGYVLTADSTAPEGIKWAAPAATGITTLNTLTAATQDFATGTSGTDFNISSSTSTHTFNIPDASGTNRGAVTTGAQSFGGAKTFSSVIDSSLTAGRNTFAGTSGDLSDDADWLFNTTGNVVTLTNGQMNVDNLRLDDNTLSSTDANGAVTVQSSGTGDVFYKKGSDSAKSVGSRNPELLEMLKYPSFEESVGEGTCTNCTSTQSTTTGSMFGTKHLDMVFGASNTGDYTIDKTTGFDNAVPAVASCYIKTTRAGVKLYGRNGGADTSAYIDVSDAGVWKKYEVPFSCGTTSCGLAVKATTATTTTVSVNECHVTLGQKTLNLGAISGWKDYGSASSFTGIGTPTVTKLQWRQVGENIEINTKFTTGTATAVEFKLALPDGYTVDSSKIGTNIVVGQMQRTSQSGIDYSAVATGADAYVGVARGTNTGSAFVRENGSTAFGNTEISQMIFSVPVTELRSQVTISGMLGPSQIKFISLTGCEPTTTSASFADLVDTDCAYASAAKIGTTVTPTTTGGVALKIPTVKAGKYYVSFSGSLYTTDAGRCSYRLYDGTNSIGPVSTDSFTGQTEFIQSFGQIVEYTSDQTNLEIKLQGRRDSGTATCYALASGDNFANIITLTPISEFGGSGTLVYSAKLSTAQVVSNENTNWINGNCTNANPTVCTFVSGIFKSGSTPNCWAAPGASNFVKFKVSSSTTTVTIENDAGVNVDLQVFCTDGP